MTDSVEVSIYIDNDSAIDGETVLFMFVRDPLASFSRPLLELKGVRRIALAAGESGSVNWQLPVASLAYLGAHLEPVLEPGRFDIHVGQSAHPDELVSCSFDLLP
jgi:beta-glucosidase